MDDLKRYFDFNTYLRQQYGCRVQKITIDAGLSCPNRDGTLSRTGCIYCNAHGSGTGAHRWDISITQQLEAGKAALAKRYKAKKFLAYFQSYTNTYAPAAQLKALYDEALAVDGVVGLCVGTRPDCVDEDIIDLLTSYTSDFLVWVEYGLQSAHDETLARINRGHDAAAFQQAVAATKNRGIPFCVHVILGLPGETRQQMMQTADFLANLGIDGIKLHLLYVVCDTVLADWYRRGNYTCLSQGQYVDLVCEFLTRLPETVVVQRLTGDPHRDELIAPEWALDKRGTLARIQQTMADRGLRQGCRRQ
ncbi:MAG: TIGR01212 family radical SAM protein [Thermodesulfobacteriota bacterium]